MTREPAAQSQGPMSTEIEDRLLSLIPFWADDPKSEVIREARTAIHDLREQVATLAQEPGVITVFDLGTGNAIGDFGHDDIFDLLTERDALRNVVLNYLDDHARLVTNEALRERKRLLLPDELVPCACDICGYAERALSSPERSSSTAAPTDGRGNGDGHYHGDTFVPRDADD